MINLSDIDLTKPENKDAALAAFKQLIASSGWLLVVDIANKNIEFLKDKILEGDTKDTIEDVNRLRDKLKAYKDIINTPNDWINILEHENISPDKNNPDPYTTVEELVLNEKK